MDHCTWVIPVRLEPKMVFEHAVCQCFVCMEWLTLHQIALPQTAFVSDPHSPAFPTMLGGLGSQCWLMLHAKFVRLPFLRKDSVNCDDLDVAKSFASAGINGCRL